MLFPLAYAVVVGRVKVEEASELDCPYMQTCLDFLGNRICWTKRLLMASLWWNRGAACILSKVHLKDDQVENAFWIYARA